MNPEEIAPEVESAPVESITTNYTGDYDQQILDVLTSIDTTLKHIDSYFALINDAVRVVLSYGFVWVPLIIVVSMLWWFFSQFLHKY